MDSLEMSNLKSPAPQLERSTLKSTPRQLGITPYANLNHYHLPQALQEKYNGWLGHELVKDFADYEDFCFKTFGDRVKNWMTFKKYVPEHTEEEDWNSLGFCMICTSYKIKG
ncbi:beta-glucosidase 44 isoform X1 [Daucus carota subsp. sativus]|uniref:beta-glucosidase 44 isoform X1 n=1 Tax=Daucus carota subsp. sativus TaxID=79200 RepID=UPI003082C39B